MTSDQTVINLASEYLPFINIPEALLAFMSHTEKKLSGTDILVYLYYWRKWRYKDFKVIISNQDLADQLGVHVSSVKRANEKLVEVGLIRRKIQKRKCKYDEEYLPSITLPAVPLELIERFKSSSMRKPYHDLTTHREITSFSELLRIAESDEANDGDGFALKPDAIKQSIAGLFANKEADTNLYKEDSLFRQVAWSIYDGQLSGPEFESDQKRLNIAVKLIKSGKWGKPKMFPESYNPKCHPPQIPPQEPTEDINF